MNRRSRRLSRAIRVVLGTILFGCLSPVPAAAQYGGVSGLFVAPSETEEGAADYTGLGCDDNEEVVLYFPGFDPTDDDPVAGTEVPGRILAVSTSIGGADPLLEGTFEFLAVHLPQELDPGVYEVRSRCGSLDLKVWVELGIDGDLGTNPDPGRPILNPGEDIPETLPLTGRDPSRVLSLAAALVAAGVGFLTVGRRRAVSSS